MKQIRIACCGMVVSTRPFPDTADVAAVADDIKETAAVLTEYGPVNVWVSEGSVSHIVGRFT